MQGTTDLKTGLEATGTVASERSLALSFLEPCFSPCPWSSTSPGHISGIAFFEEKAYIVDKYNHRILKFSPANSEAEVFFGGKGKGSDLDPSGIAFFKGDPYIVDSYNHRILKFGPGNSEAEIFFGGKGRGNDLDQLDYPKCIAFFEEKAYIVDYLNHRILKVSPANSEAEVFFGGKGLGNDLDQLHNPVGIAFFEETAYIVDSGNDRILKVSPGNSEGEIFFGGKGKGSDLDQLDRPSGIAFFEETAYIVDRNNHRILKFSPGNSEGEIFFGGKGSGFDLDQLAYPSGIAFFKGDAYIADLSNHRILKLSPGNSEGEIFFGGKGRGSDLDQLAYPKGIAFFDEKAYIVDHRNHRILKVSPANSEAEVFFGGKGLGNDLDQLHNPVGIAFFEETAYIVDWGNVRILKVSPGNSEAVVFFGGKGRGSDLDQLYWPSGLAFSDGNAYIVDSGNNRVIQVPRPRLQSLAQQADTLDLGQQLRSCTRLREHEHAGVKILQAEDSENCFVSMPREIESTAEQLALITVDNAGSKAISAQIQEKKLKLKHAQISHLPLGVSVPMRKVHFGTLLLTIAVSSMAAHASGSPRAHCLFLVFAVAFASVCYSHGWLLPLAKAGDLWPALIIPGLALPWSVVPVYLISNFAEFTQNSFGPDFQVTSCSDGVAWEFHLLTAVFAATICSIWALALSKQLQKVAETPLLLVPKFLKSYLSDGLLAWDAEPHPPLRRLEIALAWIHKGIADLYLDFISFLVMRTCGYQYAWYGFFLAILTVLLQNVGGAMYISFTVKGPQKLGYAFLCLVLTPPWKLLDPMALERVGIFLTSVRVILEDLPQLLLKVHFTLTVYRNPFVIFDILLTIPFALFDMKEVCSYCSRKEGKVETYAPVTVDDQRDRERGLVADPAFARSPDNLEDTDAAGTPRTPSNFLSCCVDFLRKSQTRAIQP